MVETLAHLAPASNMSLPYAFRAASALTDAGFPQFGKNSTRNWPGNRWHRSRKRLAN